MKRYIRSQSEHYKEIETEPISWMCTRCSRPNRTTKAQLIRNGHLYRELKLICPHCGAPSFYQDQV